MITEDSRGSFLFSATGVVDFIFFEWRIFMAQTPPGKAPTGPKVSGTRTTVSLIFLAFVLVVCGIEVRAGLGQFLTLRAFNEVSENNQFKEVPFTKAARNGGYLCLEIRCPTW